MILPLVIGTFSFVPMAASDYLRLRGRPGSGGALFAVGCGLLCVSTLWLFWESSWAGLRRICAVPMALAFVSLLLLVYSVFFAVRPRQADQLACPAGMQPLVCHGMYALCRHPGVLWLAGFYGFMALAWRSRQWLLAFALFTLADVLYVCYQDRCIFPRTIDRYGEYQKTTPFLIPTASSVKEALASFKQSERNKWP